MYTHQLDSNSIITILKSVSLMLKDFYHYGMDTKLDGFNYNSIYFNKEESKDKSKPLTKIYCIFNPTDNICGHP